MLVGRCCLAARSGWVRSSGAVGAGAVGAVLFARSPKPTTPTPAARTCQPLERAAPHPCRRSLPDRTFGQLHPHPLRHTRRHNRAMHTDGLKKDFQGCDCSELASTAAAPTSALPPPQPHLAAPPRPVHPIALPDNHPAPAPAPTPPPGSSDRPWGKIPHTRRRSAADRPYGLTNSNLVVCRFKKYDLNSINPRLLLGNR